MHNTCSVQKLNFDPIIVGISNRKLITCLCKEYKYKLNNQSKLQKNNSK